MGYGVFQRTIVDEQGNTLPGATIDVYLAGTVTRASLFSDLGGTTPITNPFNADVNGFAQFYTADGFYDIEANSGASTASWSNVQIGRPIDNLQGVGSSLNTPMMKLNFISAQTLKSSFSGEFKYERFGTATYTDIYGNLQITKYYTGTATSGSLFNLVDTLKTWSDNELVDHVVKVTTGGVTEYRWIEGNIGDSISFNKPVSVPVDVTTVYHISKPRFDKYGFLIEGLVENLQLNNNDSTLPYDLVSTTYDSVSTSYAGVTMHKYKFGIGTGGGTTDGIALSTPVTYITGDVYNESIYLKYNGIQNIRLRRTSANQTVLTLGVIDVLNGVVVSEDSENLIKIEQMADGVIRIDSPVEMTASGTTILGYRLQADNPVDADGTNGIYVGLPQIEKRAESTSVIINDASPLTRAVDKPILKFTDNMTNWKNPHSILIEFNLLGLTATANRLLLTTGNLLNGYINITNSGIITYIVAGGSPSNNSLGSKADILESNKYLFVSDGSIISTYKHGSLLANTGTVGSNNEVNTNIYLGMSSSGVQQLFGYIKSLEFFNTDFNITEAILIS